MQIEAIVRGALGARSLELDGSGKNIICTCKTAKHTSCNGIKNTQQIALKMLKSKHSPWSLAAELTLKQAPKTKVPIHDQKRMAQGEDGFSRRSHIMPPIQHSSMHSDAQSAGVCIVCKPPSWEAGQAY
jgi:hypothetical protein